MIETILSIVLLSAILYSLSFIPIEVAELKNLVNTSYDRDVSVLKLKQTLDNSIMDGGIKSGENEIQIGKNKYKLSEFEDNKYSFEIKGIEEKVVYYSNGDFSFFYTEKAPDLELRYYNNFTSFKVVE